MLNICFVVFCDFVICWVNIVEYRFEFGVVLLVFVVNVCKLLMVYLIGEYFGISLWDLLFIMVWYVLKMMMFVCVICVDS